MKAARFETSMFLNVSSGDLRRKKISTSLQSVENQQQK